MASIRQRIRDLIGAKPYIRTTLEQIQPNFPTVDTRRTDYAFWDRARRGAATGLELSGLFIKPLGSKVAAWVLGQIPRWLLENEQAEEFMIDWFIRNHPKIVRGYEEAVDLGDAYLVINPDLSVTLIPPHVVTAVYNPNNPAERIGWKIREVYPVWGEYQNVVVVDIYTATYREHYVEINGIPSNRRRYRNLIGKNPMIHIANLFGADEQFGRPEGEALIPALHRYGDVIETALKGNIRQGRPTPVIQKLGTEAQVDRFWEQYGRTETYTMPDGTTQTVTVIDFNPDQLIVLSGDSEFLYASPDPFSVDTQNLLGLLFYLILQHTEIPEFVWGNAISASKASAESQLEPFVKWLEKKRAAAAGWLTEVAEVVIAYMAILRPDIPEVTELPLLQWPAITNEDAKVVLLSVEWAYKNHLLTGEEALALTPLHVADPRRSVEKGMEEWEEFMKKQAALMPQDPNGENNGDGTISQRDKDEIDQTDQEE